MKVASLAQGPAAAMQQTATVWYGMAIHAVLSALFGIVFVVLTEPIGGRTRRWRWQGSSTVA